MNIRFEYLYRDAGNFKNWGEVVFSNPHNVPADTIASIVNQALIDHIFFIDRIFFVAANVGVPDLHFSKHIEKLDHDWHEVHAFQPTDDPPNDVRNRDIEAFVESLRSASDCVNRIIVNTSTTAATPPLRVVRASY